MITAVDTNVLIDVFGNDPAHGERSAVLLRQCLGEGSLVACDVVWSETRAFFETEIAFTTTMATLGVAFAPLEAATAARAGAAWRAYRRGGGSRTRVMADYLIGAHGLLQADRLLTRDRGYYREAFKGLQLVPELSRAYTKGAKGPKQGPGDA